MPYLKRDNGVRLYYDVRGAGPPVILGHSFLCSGAMWNWQLDPLARRHLVINVDLRGHGRSGVAPAPFDLYDLVDDLLAILDRLGLQSAVWAGLSIGGMVALRAALVAPDRVSGLILLDTDAGAETGWNKRKYKVLTAAARLLGTEPLLHRVERMMFCRHTRKTQPDLVKEWHTRFAAVPLDTIRLTVAALSARDTILDKLARVQVPALVMVGAEDQPLPPARAKQIAAALPRARLQIVDQAGHLCTLEQPHFVTAAMLAFLGELPPPSPDGPAVAV